MGLGYTLSEQFAMRDGRTLNTTFLDYKMPAAEGHAAQRIHLRGFLRGPRPVRGQGGW